MAVKSIFTKDFINLKQAEKAAGINFTRWISEGFAKDKMLPMYVRGHNGLEENKIYYFDLESGHTRNADFSLEASLTYQTKIRFISTKRNIESIYKQNF